MTRFFSRRLDATVLFAAVLLLGAPQDAATQEASDETAVAAVVAGFHSALNEGRADDALALLADDAVILEGGGQETKAEYASHHLEADIAFATAVDRVRGDLTVVVQGDVAWAMSTSRTTGEVRGREIDSRGGELMVLSRTPDGWIIRSISWS
ncbi:MAG: nuclear transport factor 2 family protein [Gemmatimonadetes bacterium]|nr:nuclear transport factor 2 family protein [Gemmatimonadota bacterium]NNF38357.1 nuclear transport factor 2 family protein [Gemmatimonadota bacterium]NNK63963.1 nuclear transport factor 2 family protein [Gemmatimonadota bacterium]